MKKVFSAVVVSSLLLSGCGMFKTDHAWRHASQRPPLDIPSNYDRPDVSDALMIPRVNEHPDAGMAEHIHVAADVATAFGNVGSALNQAGLGTVLPQAGGAHGYRVRVGEHLTKQNKGWFSGLFSGDDSQDALAPPPRVGVATVTVSAGPGAGSTVTVQGDSSAVAKVAAALKSRLGH